MKPTTNPPAAQPDYETEADRLYAMYTRSATDGYTLADIEAALLYEVDDND